MVPYELYYYFSWFSLTSHYDFFPWQENCSQPLTVNHKLTEQNKITQWSNPRANLMKPKSRRAAHFCRQWSYLISCPCFHFKEHISTDKFNSLGLTSPLPPVCPPGTYGEDCNQVCQCSARNEDCHPVTGRCTCLPGYHGNHCQFRKYSLCRSGICWGHTSRTDCHSQ